MDDVEKSALEQVAAMLQRPDHLEKLPEFRKRAERKKAAVEAMLRTGVQSQLESIRTAIAHLHTASEDINTVDKEINSLRSKLKPFPGLKEKMKEVRIANALHSQYAAAMDNLKHIFNINQTIADTHVALEQGKLLLAHKHIMDLEQARDELLTEVHKTAGNREYEKNLLITFFIKVDELVNTLGSNMWYVIGRSLDMAKGSESGLGPQQLVSCLRIVEREERIDKYYLDAKGAKDFMPPNRPREWKKKTFDTLEKTVWNRVEGNQLEDDRGHNKSWLARYLETMRVVVTTDLLHARAAISCFPPDYQIYDRFVHMYHNCVCKRVREIASENLEKSELVQLMSWIQSYGGEDFLGSRRLQIASAALLQDMPVLEYATWNKLCDLFIAMTKRDMKQWLAKMLSAEKDDWYQNVKPDEDNFSYFYTSLPNILFGMLRDTVTLAKEVSVEVIPSVINLTVEEFYDFATKYQDAFKAYRDKYFEDRSLFPSYTSIMIAVANNLQTCIESTERYMQQVRLSMENDEGNSTRRGPARQQIIDNIDKLNGKWNGAISLAVEFIGQEVCEDLAKYLAEIFSRKWLVGSSSCETICMTLSDYFLDHRHLRPNARGALLADLHFRIVGEYLRAIDKRRLTFASHEERLACGERLQKDIEKIDEVFTSCTESEDLVNQFTLLTPVLHHMTGIITLTDKGMLSLEATSFGRKYPNFPVDLLASLIATREDMSRVEAKSLAEEVMSHVQFHPKDEIFAQLFASAQSSESSWKPSINVANFLPSFVKLESGSK
ncbi:unnamed protein product [Auanema sp. JU1783]|nr:unnamed protein product [Auanema sp. JU1783]